MVNSAHNIRQEQRYNERYNHLAKSHRIALYHWSIRFTRYGGDRFLIKPTTTRCPQILWSLVVTWYVLQNNIQNLRLVGTYHFEDKFEGQTYVTTGDHNI
jgi:hypothetical protein